MTAEQNQKIVDKLQGSGFARISNDDCRKIVMLVYSELVAAAVFTPLEKDKELLPFDDDVREMLGWPCFRCRNIAHALRAAGLYECKNKAEDEQATAIHWMLTLYLKHGKAWREEGKAILKLLFDRAERPAETPGV